MIAIISPAKTLDYERKVPPLPVTAPRFGAKAGRLAAAAARLSPGIDSDFYRYDPGNSDEMRWRFSRS